MNNDTVIDKNAIRALVETGEKYHRNAIVSGKVYHFDKPDVIQYVGHNYSNKKLLKRDYPFKNQKDVGQCKESERDMLDDIFWLFPAKLINEIGYYNSNFFLYMEQADFALRAKNAGYTLIFTPDAKLWHKGGLTSGDGQKDSPVVLFWKMKSSIIFYYLHLEKRYFFYFLIERLIKLMIRGIKAIIRFDKINYIKFKAAITGFYYGLKWLIRKKPDNGYNPYITKRT